MQSPRSRGNYRHDRSAARGAVTAVCLRRGRCPIALRDDRSPVWLPSPCFTSPCGWRQAGLLLSSSSMGLFNLPPHLNTRGNLTVNCESIPMLSAVLSASSARCFPLLRQSLRLLLNREMTEMFVLRGAAEDHVRPVMPGCSAHPALAEPQPAAVGSAPHPAARCPALGVSLPFTPYVSIHVFPV